MGIDYLAAGSNKGLLGTLGCGFVYCSDRIVKDIVPPYAGYQSTVSHVSPPSITTNFDHLEWYPHARRFESGNLSYNCILALSEGVGLLLELHADQHGEYLARLEQFLQDSRFRVLEALGSRELLGVAIVAPGPYDLSSDTVYNQRLPQLNGVRIKDLFRRCFGDYEYYVDEDVKFAVRSFSDLSRCELLYYLYIGEGVGGAAVHSGNMLRGLNATAGDAGHLLSGGSVTFESLLSTDAFIRLLGLDESLSAEARQEALCRIAAEEPARYDEALDQMAAITAQMLHSVLWMLDPTHIIVDCIYARPRSDAFLRALSAHLQARFEGENRVLPRLCPGASGLSSVVRGAVHALQRAWLDRILM